MKKYYNFETRLLEGKELRIGKKVIPYSDMQINRLHFRCAVDEENKIVYVNLTPFRGE